ncbi:MAG: FlgD immunoglobulin-like domain containing protein, partial [bacterium]
YRLPRAAHVTLRIYNLMGQEVQTLAHEEHQPGVYKIEWDGSNHHGQAVATGLYVVRMVAGDFTKSKKILLLR